MSPKVRMNPGADFQEQVDQLFEPTAEEQEKEETDAGDKTPEDE